MASLRLTDFRGAALLRAAILSLEWRRGTVGSLQGVVCMADSRASDEPGADLPVLLVEDEPVNQRVIARILKKHGYRVEVAGDGQRALELLRHARFGLIIMDCEMPVLNGYEAAQAIRKGETGAQRIPIVAVTAHELQDAREEILAAGMDDCVSKLELDARLPEQLARWYPRAAAVAPRTGSGVNGSSRSPALDPSFQRSAATVRVFLKHVGGQWQAIEAAARANDLEALSRAAHKLKGSCLAVGIPRLATLCAELELNPTQAATLLEKIERELSRTRVQLEGMSPRPS
jgi:CheY-like chemotaxis protein/HPt (histidine-containing phosphotransfer) domain-containing protein